MLQVKHLETFYGASQALFDISLDIAAGEVVTLLGRNGMGKTTTVNTLMGIVRSHRGQVLFDNQSIQHLAPYQIAQRGLALVPEGRQIFPNLTVWENLMATSANRDGRRHPWTVDGIFEMFPLLTARRHHMGRLLSGGEQQMLAIGRALMTNPKLLMLDDATEGLAPLVRRQIWTCLESLKRNGQSILVIDKNLDDITRIADRHYLIEKGKVVWHGDSAALRQQRDVLQRYLGV